MVKQYTHKEEVRPGQEVREPARCAHRPGQDQISSIVGVTANTPPARREEDALMLLSIIGSIIAADECSRASPEDSVAILCANVVSLVIR